MSRTDRLPRNPRRVDRALREFHVSRRARDRYGFDQGLFALRGNVVFADFRAAREFAHRMNHVRDVRRDPERAIEASQLNAMGLIDELMHLAVARYRDAVNPRLMAEALADLEGALGRDRVDEVLLAFVDEFPPLAVYRGELSVESYLMAATGGVSHREAALEELLLLWLANRNPAFAPFRELFDDSELRASTAYLGCMEALQEFIKGQPEVEGMSISLLELLERPMRTAPDSLEGQLEFIRNTWSAILGPELQRVLSSLDFIAEARRIDFGPGPGPVEPPSYTGLDEEFEAYSSDLDWMPRVVLLAKNVYVWMDQLSASYGRSITTLDEVPDDELDRLAGWGITGLWLIGVWERSRASARIKRRMGDEEAVASAYSLADYHVAHDLGGDDAYDRLRWRAWERGIRMSTDMVPNHVGIDSRWVVQHPDWFLGLDHSPFPAYSFNGPDLCDDERVGVYIEDHYWDRSDAAVVFKRVDHWTGDERFIYHGNDGTSMPWNDTAQLDYRNPEVREAVIQTILEVARRSPIIRFDAAMTLAKKHYHRLWFPEPGSGGDIPSRADFGMTRAEFDAVMPNEFWREVVDRVAAEAPDTLLLAEAFWLLEGYFVRTLGMHRVYNSAFMNMLRDERNADYRQLIKSTLEFDPQILKRYVNFMSNPDERTAIDQFGKDDKYFGVATMMATMPGLPMFGHGQIEGFTEKYGMEFRRPRWDERPDDDLVRRHERQLFPLLRRRGAFADVEHFRLFDLYREDGTVDENVFAYTNGSGRERSLVLFHNRYAETRGWIRTSAAVRDPWDGGRGLRQTSLGVALGLPADEDSFVAFRDVLSGQEHLRACRQVHEHGLFVELRAYSHHVFLGFRELRDDGRGRLARLAFELAGRSVASVDEALAELDLEPVLGPFRELVSAERLRRLTDARVGGPAAASREEILDEARAALEDLLEAAGQRFGTDLRVSEIASWACAGLERLLRLPELARSEPTVRAALDDEVDRWAAALCWMLLRGLAGGIERSGVADDPLRWYDEWYIGRNIVRSLIELGLGEQGAARAESAVRVLLLSDRWWEPAEGEEPSLQEVALRALAAREVHGFLGVNTYRGTRWFVKESFEEWLRWLVVAMTMRTEDGPRDLAATASLVRLLERAAAASDYRFDELVEGVSEGGDPE